MAEMCGAGLHEMIGENQHYDKIGRKAGCAACVRMRGKKRDDTWCRNGHARTEENTHVDDRGLRHCKDCPSWPAYEERMTREARHATTAPPLSERELRRLRASVPCVVCGEIPREVTVMMKKRDKATGEFVEVATVVVKIPHWPNCPVPSNREGDGKGPGRPKKYAHRAHRDQTVTTSRPDTECRRCGAPVKQPWPKRTIMYCGNTCKSYASRERQTKAGAR
jgi:hypothetical protein